MRDERETSQANTHIRQTVSLAQIFQGQFELLEVDVLNAPCQVTSELPSVKCCRSCRGPPAGISSSCPSRQSAAPPPA